MYPINLDQNLARKLDLGMRSGEGVDLPFPVAYVWALNGQPSYKAQGGALYFGGWACKAEDLQAVAEGGGRSIPQDWKQVTVSTRDGDEYEAYTTRHAFVAPIGKRESWLHDGQRSTTYIEGGRRHLQVLAYLAESQGKNGSRQLVPWGPIVLTAKGYQARNLLDAFSRWDRATVQVRRRVAPGVPAWCFYMALGTFEKERRVVNVGKPGAQSPITPISVHVPEPISDDYMASLFIGQEVAAVMADLQDQAQDWLKAWEETLPVIAGGAIEEYAEMAFHAPEEEIPF